MEQKKVKERFVEVNKKSAREQAPDSSGVFSSLYERICERKAIAMQLHSYCNAIYLLLIIYLLIYLYSLFFLLVLFFFFLDLFEKFSKNHLTTESERCTLRV